MSDCILTTFNLNAGGYGRASRNGKVINHHRAVYMDTNKLTDLDMKGLVVRHTCDNRACINPLHLLAGTQADNMADKKARGRPNGGGPTPLLTDKQVASIRSCYGIQDQEQLAAEFKVSQATVSDILLRKRAYASR